MNAMLQPAMPTLPRPIRTLMLIDDSDIEHSLHHKIIEASGLVDTVMSFQYAEDALHYLRTDGAMQVDAILVDINMPGLSASELPNLIATDNPDRRTPRVVVMLPTVDDPDPCAGLQTGFAQPDALHKPLRTSDIADLVREMEFAASP